MCQKCPKIRKNKRNIASENFQNRKIFRNKIKIFISIFSFVTLMLAFSITVFATTDNTANVDISINGEGADTVRIILLLTIVSLLPSILIMMTSFTRIVIVFSFLKQGLGMQQTPPNQVIIGISLFLSLFIMSPVLSQINEEAYEPYSRSEISSDEFLSRAQVPLKKFMLNQTKENDLVLFMNLSGITESVNDESEIGMEVIVPAFMTSEIKRAFTIGFLLLIPFLVIDIVVASTLMSMGMVMLPPVTISMPFKIMLFVLVDGWGLLIKNLIMSFNV